MLSEEDYGKVAKEALHQYPIYWEKLVYLGKSDNVTFQVQTNDDHQKFLIKIHISTISIQSKGNITSELIWLEALVKDTNLVVPVPVRNLQGDLGTEISTDLSENTIMVTIHHWIHGSVLQREPTSNETENLELISSEVFVHVEESAHKIANVIQNHKRLPSNWGVIHSDLHESNYVFYEDTPRPIDFSNCGYGFYLFDMAETFLHLSSDNRKVFISSYSKVNQLEENYVELLEAFFIWSIIRTFAFHSLNSNEQQSLATNFPSVIENYFRKYLKGEKFLLN
ncbi:phosphotransferase [Paenibacillus amylolyticus]|nr:phosphotransferase [Paenibacillus amylolyticus]